MGRQFRYAAALLLAQASLALSTCRPPAAVATPSAALAPAGAEAQVATPSSSPTSIATPQPSQTPSLHLLWTFGTQGAIWGSASVSDSTVYFGSDDGYLYAVDAATGHLRWKFSTEGIVRSRPAIDGALAYVASDDGDLYAVDIRSGKQVWRTDIGNATPRERREHLEPSGVPTTFDYLQSSPVVADGQVYVGSVDGNVYAVAADSGSTRWTYQTGAKVRATPMVDNGTLYVGSWDLSFYALDTRTGQPRWSTLVLGEVQSTALVAQRTVYTASRRASVVALDVQTGEKIWEYNYGNNMWVESSPRLANGVLYIGSSGSKIVMGLDSQTGTAFTKFSSDLFHWSTPAIVGNTLYIGGTTTPGNIGGLLALKLVGGKFSPDAGDQRFLPVTGMLEASSGWSGVASSPVVVDGVIYFGGLDGKLYAVRDG